MIIKGMDISHYQGAVDWKKVTAKFAYLKATEGETYIDPKFKENWAGAQGVNIPVGAYHFLHPENDAGIQAQHFCEVLASVTGHRLPPVLDIEKTGGVSQALILAKVKKWLEFVEQHTGQKPIIYTYTSFAKQIRLSKVFSGYPLWIAQYGVKSPLLCGWAAWRFWQFSSSGKVPGIVGNVDMDYFAGTIKELKALCL